MCSSTFTEDSVHQSLSDCLESALAGVARWVGHRPIHRKVAGLVPRQGTCLGRRFGPQLVGVQARGNRSMFLSPSLPSPLSKINEHVLR